MRTKLLAASTFLCLLVHASAAGADGLYVSYEAGASSVGDWEHTRTKWTPCGLESADARASFDYGAAVFGAFGYAFDGWRFELEGGYRTNDTGNYVRENRRRSYTFEPEGELNEVSVMANVIYDIHLVDRFSLSLGAGAGGDYAHLRLDTHWAPVDDGAFRFAYQGLAGLNYAVTEATMVFVNYRYTRVDETGFAATPEVYLVGDGFEKQAATAGVRFALFVPSTGVASPAPTPVPVAIEREFMVFFEFNRANLTPEALATIRQVIGAVHASGSVSIRVVGHADRAGSIAYNKALSLRRARSVKKALVVEGLASSTISIAGRGESEPMVPTADGVREPQNRRVHISF